MRDAHTMRAAFSSQCLANTRVDMASVDGVLGSAEAPASCAPPAIASAAAPWTKKALHLVRKRLTCWSAHETLAQSDPAVGGGKGLRS